MSKAKELLGLLEGMTGVVTRNRSLPDKNSKKEITLDLGFVKVGKEEVAFTSKTDFGKNKITDFKPGDKVKVEVQDTTRGKHATKMLK